MTKQLQLDIHFVDAGNAHVILARHVRVQGAFRKVLLVGYAFSCDDDIVKLKDCTKDLRAHLSSFDFFRKKKIDVQVLVSVFGFLTDSNGDPGTSIFCEKKKTNHNYHPHN